MMGTLALSRVDTRSTWQPGAGWVGELVINSLDSRINSVGSALVAFFSWDESISLLGCGPGEGVDLVLGMACVSAAVYHQHLYLEVIGTNACHDATSSLA